MLNEKIGVLLHAQGNSLQSRVWPLLCNPKRSKAMVAHVNTNSAHVSNLKAHYMAYMHWGDCQPLSACSGVK